MISVPKMGLILHQFEESQKRYPQLILSQNVFGNCVVRGPIQASAVYEGETLEIKGVVVEILLPGEYPSTPPIVRETSGMTKEFHTNGDGTLCLGSPLAVKATFARYPTILGFVEELVIPFFFAFEYWRQRGELPFGELSHGGKGILQYYQDLFGVQIEERVLGLLRILADNDYRGHHKCPCGSNYNIRHCHGETITSIGKLQTSDDFFADYGSIAKHLLELDVVISKEFIAKRFSKKYKIAKRGGGINDIG